MNDRNKYIEFSHIKIEKILNIPLDDYFDKYILH
jgi:hypothetical protein